MTQSNPYSERRLFGDPLDLDPKTTAVLVIDMLNDFCHEEGILGNPNALTLCSKQTEILRAVRRTGGTVIFVNEQHRKNLVADHGFAQHMRHAQEGSWGSEVVESLVVENSDISVVKRRYSGFFETDLDLVLRDRGVSSAILIGVLTNICRRATAHDAFFRGYNVIVPADAVGAMSSLEQVASLFDISTHFGWVSDTCGVVRALETGTPIDNADLALADQINQD